MVHQQILCDNLLFSWHGINVKFKHDPVCNTIINVSLKLAFFMIIKAYEDLFLVRLIICYLS